MRRLVLAPLAVVLALPVAPPATAQSPTLARKLARALAVPHVKSSRSGAVALDLDSGRMVFVRNPNLPLAPASNEKLPLTYAALTALGAAFRIETQALGVGQQEDTLWRGNLVLKGFGDPSLSTSDLRALAAQVRAAGIRRVTGRVLGDESWFDTFRTAPGWKPSFYGEESPPLSALTVDRGRPYGSISSQPALGAAQVFRTALVANGVAVAGTAGLGRADELAIDLGSVRSPSLAVLLRYMDRESDNFTAEMLLKELGATQSGHGTSPAGAALVMSALTDAGVPMAGVRIVDGSGLSRLDRLTAGALVALLETSWADPTVRPILVSALPVAGISGTLQDRMRRLPARGNVFAKTGTTSEASALSGYVKTRFAFAVLQNGSPLPYWWARTAQDRFATVLAAS